MSTVVTCYHCKKHKVRDCEILIKKMKIEKSAKFYSVRKKWCSFRNSNGHSEECYQQKICSKCKDNASTVDDKKVKNHKMFFTDSTPTDWNDKSCYCKG